jgi:hypothetical protein
VHTAGRPVVQAGRPARRDQLSGLGLDDPEHRALWIAEDGDATDGRHVHRLHECGAAELLRLRSRCVRVTDRNVRLPVRRDRCILEGHQSRDAGFADLEGSVTAEIGAHVLGRPAEDLLVKALGAVDVGCGQLVPHEDTLRARAVGVGLVDAHEGALRIGDDCHATDLAHLEWAGRELATRALDLQKRLVDVLDPDMAEPVRRRSTFRSFPETAVALSA